MKKTLFLSVAAFILLHTNFAFSINLSGTYTIGATGNYTNLTAVANILNATNGNTVTGNCTFEILSDYSGVSEVFPIVFKQFSASDAAFTITIRPQSGVGSVLTAGSSSTAILSMDSADNYIFDGRAGGSGNSIWTIRNTRSSNTYGPAIRLLNGATNNTFTYLNVESQNASTSSGNIYIQGTVNTTANNNNTISYCKIRNRADATSTHHTIGIYAAGNTLYQNSGNIITDCEFYNHFNPTASTYAVYINTGNTDYTISNNKIYQTETLSFTTGTYHMGIRVYNTNGNNFIINNNTIGYANNTGTGTYTINGNVATIFNAIYLTVGTSTASSVQGNRINGIELTTTATSNSGYGIFSGIYITAGMVNIGNISGNYIGDTNSIGISILKTIGSTSATLINGIRSSSTSTLEIKNNIVAGISFTSDVDTSFLYVTGIGTSGTAGNYTIENNKIGSFTDGHSIQIGTNGFSIGGGRFLGITNSATGNVSIKNNAIGNITNYCKGNDYFISIYYTSGTGSIENNEIFNLISYSSRAGSITSPALAGIIKSTTLSGGFSVNNNLIYNLFSKNDTSAVYNFGLYYSGNLNTNQEISGNIIFNLHTETTSVTSYTYGLYIGTGKGICEKNYVHSLTPSAGKSNLMGIRIYGGNFMVSNNRIRLGIDVDGNSISEAVSIFGIYKSSGLSNSIYHNSVYLGGSNVGATAINTAAFYRTVTSSTDYIKNNIFVNNRSNNTTGGNHYCYILNGTGSANIDYNLYYFTGTGGNLASLNNGTTPRNTLRNVRENITSQELHSAFGNPGFINSDGNSLNLNMDITGITPVEGSGISLTEVSNDFNGDNRTGLTAVDMGSDAGNFTPNDLFTPIISYTTLSNTTDSTSRSLINVKISDIGSGIPTVGANKPRIWYRISSTPSTVWVSNEGTINSGDSLSGLWSFILNYTKLSRTVKTGDVIQYYVVAQDQAGAANIWYEPFTGASHTGVSVQTTPPTTPKSYTVTNTGLSGTYSVGTGGDFPSLTGATTGFFAVANAKTISGNITLEIISNLTETGSQALNALSIANNTFSVSIVPADASEKIISGSYNGSLIRLNGADSIYIDGSYGGSGKYLRFRNNNTSSGNGVFSFINSACYNKIENTFIEGGTNNYLISFGTTNTTTGNSFNLIQNNIIRDRTDIISVPTYGIYSTGTGTTGQENTGNSIRNNEILNFLTSGIFLNGTGNGNDWIIDNNQFYNNLITNPSTNQYPIYISSANANNLQIINNYIGGQDVSCGGNAWKNTGAINFYGIYISNLGSISKSVIDNNTIQNIHLSNVALANFCGIYMATGSINCGTSNGNLIGSESDASSILIDGTGTMYAIRFDAGESNIKKNTIANIDQTSSTPGYSFGILVNSTNNSTIEKNKIFSIGPSSAVTTSYSISGIRLNSSSGGSTLNVFNNSVSLGVNTNSNSENIYGIYYHYGTNTEANIFNNTVFLTGNVSSASNLSYCFLKDGAANANLKNNLFYNQRNGSGSLNYSIGFTNTSGIISSDYNLLISTNSGEIGRWGSTSCSYSTFVTTSHFDSYSWSETTSKIASDRLFSNPDLGDLSLIRDNPECWLSNGNGIPMAEISTDIDENPRNSSNIDGTIDIGAYEFLSEETNFSFSATQSGTIGVGSSTTYLYGGRTIAKIDWISGTGLPTSIDAHYMAGIYHPGVTSGSPLYAYSILTQSGGTDFTYDLTLYFNDALTGKIENPTDLSVAKSEDGVNWTEYAGIVDNSAKTIKISALNSFSTFNVVGTGDAEVLPIELLSFDAKQSDKIVKLTWSTASEQNNDYFEILRSNNSVDFIKIGETDGHGTSNQLNTYTFMDNTAEYGINYYRLVNYDYDGTSYFSSTIWVNIQNSNIKIIQDGTGFTIETGEISNDPIYVNLYESSGKLIMKKVFAPKENIKIDKTGLKGVYLVQIMYNNDIQTFKLDL